MYKKLAPIREKYDITHEIQLRLHERMNKKQVIVSHMIVPKINKNDEIKKSREGQ